MRAWVCERFWVKVSILRLTAIRSLDASLLCSMLFKRLSKFTASFSLFLISRSISDRIPSSCSMFVLSDFIFCVFLVSSFWALSLAWSAFFFAYSMNEKYASKSLTSLNVSTSILSALEFWKTSKSLSPLNIVYFRISDGKS